MDLFAQTLNAHRAMEFFGEISAIPRASGSEKAIADYVEAFGHAHGLYTYRDEYNDVLLRYTPEHPVGEPILLQGHMDMVCVKTTESTHNFDTDPLELFLDDNGFLGAKGTTLGGDDGIAVAMMLAVLEQKGNREIECLFTVNEECGMDGAIHFDYSKIRSRQMLNLDSETEDEAVVSCAGGLDLVVRREYTPCTVSGSALTVTLDGFSGGHSGAEIHLGHINATRQLAKILDKISEKYDCRLISLTGGEKRNSIPRHAEAVILVGEDADAEITEQFKRAKHMFTEADARAQISLSRAPYTGNGFDMNATKQIFKMVAKTKNGVVSVFEELNLVKTSLNMGVVSAADGVFNADISMRSASYAEKHALADSVTAELEKYGAVCTQKSEYPGWEYVEESPLRDLYVEKYKAQYGKAPHVCGIHAGLECVYIALAIPGMDMLSVGPDIHDIHTVKERLDLASCERFWNLLQAILYGEKR